MARVVQRRGTPPYLLILFVFLFVIATVLAVLFYVQDNDKAKLLTQRDEEKAALGQKLDKAQNQQLPALAKKITGRMVSADAALAEADQALSMHADAYANQGLIPAVQGLDGMVKAHEGRITQLEKRERELGDAVAKQTQSNKNLKSDYEKTLRGVTKALSDAQAAHARDLADKDTQRGRALAEKDAIITRREQKITVLTQEKDELMMETQKRDARIAKIQKKLRVVIGRPKLGLWVLKQGDGKIAKVLPDRNIVFIDLGERDNIKPGLPFSVYSRKTGIPDDGKPKAKIIVVNVGPTTSECRVTAPAKEGPITEGDVVANVVYDTSRVHNFVVEGEFDLYAEGRADPLGNRRVRALVNTFGGKIADLVSVDTDFVIMGEEPPRPPEPAGDAPAGDWQLFNDKMRKYNHYKQIFAAAQTLQIPVLNTTRFLAFSGYVPVKRLSE